MPIVSRKTIEKTYIMTMMCYSTVQYSDGSEMDSLTPKTSQQYITCSKGPFFLYVKIFFSQNHMCNCQLCHWQLVAVIMGLKTMQRGKKKDVKLPKSTQNQRKNFWFLKFFQVYINIYKHI